MDTRQFPWVIGASTKDTQTSMRENQNLNCLMHISRGSRLPGWGGQAGMKEQRVGTIVLSFEESL